MVGAVELHDVRDAERFVSAHVARLLAEHHIRLGAEDREDLEAHGLEEMLRLAQRYRPAHARKREDWSFTGYANDLLPKRLLDELRKRMIRRRRADGSRVWEPRPEVASLDRLMEAPSFDEGRVVLMTRFQQPPVSRPDRLAA